MSNSGNRSAGWILIAIGLLFLLHYLFGWNFYWAMVLILVGGVLFVSAIFSKSHRGVFPGTLLLLLGLLFLLRQTEVLDDSRGDLWPLIIVILGVSFVMVSLLRPREWGHLVPGGISLIIGLLLFLRSYLYLSRYTLERIFHWWPLILVILGVWLLLGRRRTHEEGQSE